MNQIGVGFQGTYAGKRLDGGKLNFEEELDQFGGWTNPTNEPINNRAVGVNYFDLNAGILYNGSTTGYNNFYLGASFYHINRPKESFDGGFYLLNPRLTLHGGGYFPLPKMPHTPERGTQQAGRRYKYRILAGQWRLAQIAATRKTRRIFTLAHGSGLAMP
jgi:hypothetical protein